MNVSLLKQVFEKALAGTVSFPEILATLKQQDVESYHVDMVRRECRFYANIGESCVTPMALVHAGVAEEFSEHALVNVNRRVQTGQANYSAFVREAAAAGCAYYIVYLNGRKVRYFGRNGDESIQYFPGSRQAQGQDPAARAVRSLTKTVDINAPLDEVFSFLADPLNWPRYAVVNLRSVSASADGWCKAVTRFGQGEIKVQPVKELGILDHVWRDPQASWHVNSRVVPNGGGATVMMTFFQPAVMSDTQFDAAMSEMDIEMRALRKVFEEPG